MTSELYNLTIHAALDGLQAKEFSSVELTQSVLDRIDAVEKDIQGYLTVTPELALEQAAAADQKRASGEEASLLGIPIAIKDALATEGVQTTAGSQILKGYVPPYNATAVEKLSAAGMVMLGKTNLDEFAMGSSTENSGYYTTRNPWDLERVPGGSSGGSAAVVSAGEAIGSIGSDTGGSLRLPGSYCGVVGLKPSYGRVSRYGLFAYGSSLDQIGPLTKDVRDAAMLLNVISGHDQRDSTSLSTDVPDYTAALTGEIAGLKIGIPAEYFGEGLDSEVEQGIRKAISHMEGLGAEVVEISLPNYEKALPAYYLIAPAEASANLTRYDGVRFGYSANSDAVLENYRESRGQGFGPEVKRRIMLGTYALSAGYYDAYYLKAQQVRTLVKQDFDAAFSQVDVIASPVAPGTAFKIGELSNDPLAIFLADVYTVSLNLAGICGISVPCGFDSQKLPIGLQIIGPHMGEEAILRTAYAYEQSTEWHKMSPTL